MSGDHYPCPVPGEAGVRAGDGGRLGAILRAEACGVLADEAAAELLVRQRFPPGIDVASAGGSMRGEGR